MQEEAATPATAPVPESAPAVPPPVAPEPEQPVTPEPVAEPPAMPDWFMADKYTSIEEQARAQFEMRKLMGQNWGAPKDGYKLENIEGIVKDDVVMSQLTKTFKEMNLSEEAVGKIAKSWVEANAGAVKAFEAELSKDLTPAEAQRINRVNAHIKEKLSPEHQAIANSWIVNKKDFEVFENIFSLIPPSTNVPSSTTGTAVKFETVQEVNNEKVKYRKEVAAGLRVEDKNYLDQLAERFRAAYTRENPHKK